MDQVVRNTLEVLAAGGAPDDIPVARGTAQPLVERFRLAEFNVWQDPEAATCVTECAVATAMYGLDVFTRLSVDRGTADQSRASADPGVRRRASELLYRRLGPDRDRRRRRLGRPLG